MRITNGVKLTTMIVALVVGSIVASIAVVSSVIYINLHARSVSASFDQQVANIGVAVTLLERRISGAMLNWRASSSRSTSSHTAALSGSIGAPCGPRYHGRRRL